MNKTEFKKLSEDEVIAHITNLETKLTEAEAAKTEAEDAVLELNQKLADVQETAKTGKQTVTVDKQTYAIAVGKLRVTGEWAKELGKTEITAAEIAENPKYAAHLVKSGSGALVLVEPKEK